MLVLRRSRRICAFVLAVMMLFAFMLQAAALDEKYRFEELKMAVSVPRDYYVVTRDSESDDPVFKTLNLSDSAFRVLAYPTSLAIVLFAALLFQFLNPAKHIILRDQFLRSECPAVFFHPIHIF